MEDLLKAIKLEPDWAFPYNEAAWCLCEDLDRPEEALPLAQEAVTRAPEVDEFWNTLGVVYYRLGEYRKSLGAFEHVERLRPDGLVAYDLFFIAMNHHRLGNAVQAEDYYAQAVDDLKRKADWSAVAMTQVVDKYLAEAAGLLGKDPAQ